jgi:hypothetical protein
VPASEAEILGLRVGIDGDIEIIPEKTRPKKISLFKKWNKEIDENVD